jgi:DnaJ-domain-containing protein 1
MLRRRLLALLDLPASADTPAVKSRYRELAKSLHPDVKPGCAESSQRFASITEAYQKLLQEHESTPTPAADTQSPAMQARWNIRRRANTGEYPSWFKPDKGST